MASGAVLVGVGALLPEWFLPFAFILLIMGLPVVLARASEPREMGCLIRLLVIDGIVRIAFGGIGVYAGIFFYIEERRLVDPGAGSSPGWACTSWCLAESQSWQVARALPRRPKKSRSHRSEVAFFSTGFVS